MTAAGRTDDDVVAAGEDVRASPAAISTDLVVHDGRLDPARAAALVEAWRTTRTRISILLLPLGALAATVVMVAGGHVVVPVRIAEFLVPAALGASAACLAVVAAAREARFRRRCAELGLTPAARAQTRELLAVAGASADDDLLVRLLTGGTTTTTLETTEDEDDALRDRSS